MAAILKMFISVYFSKIRSNFGEILCAEADWDCNENYVTKLKMLPKCCNSRWRTDAVLEIIVARQRIV